jgi:hypothetical protein
VLAVRDHLPQAVLYSSAVARGVVPDFPPTTKTSPLTSRVAVGAERGVLRLPVVVQVPDWPSADRPVPPSRAMVSDAAEVNARIDASPHPLGRIMAPR